MNVRRNLMVGGFVCLLTGAVNATDVVWTGAVNGTWDTATLNWWDGVSAVAFASGSNVRFDDSTAVTNVAIAATLTAGKVAFSNEVFNYLLSGSKLGTATSFVKSGSGKLTINNKDHAYTGNLLVEGGELIADVNNDSANVTSGALGNPRVARTITVTNGASLTFKNSNPFGGGGTSTSRILATLNIVGGTLNLTTNFANNLGPVILDNATLTYSSGLFNFSGAAPATRYQSDLGRFWGTAMFGSNVVFRGTNVYNFPVVGNEYKCGFTFGKYEPSDLIVEDITGNANSDVIFALPIGYTINADGVNTRFNKKGAGTLELSYGSNFYTGDVRVVEGTLLLSGRQVSQTATVSPLGNPKVSHRLYVGTNATLSFAQSDVMGQAYAHSLITIEVDGGTLSQTATKVNSFGPLILNNAKLNYSGCAVGATVAYPTGYYTNAANVVTITNQIVGTTLNETTTVVTNQVSSNTATTYLGISIDPVSAQYTNKVSVAYTNVVYTSDVYETVSNDATIAVSTNVLSVAYTNVVSPLLYNVPWGTFYFDGDVAFKGTNTYTLANNMSGAYNSLMRCGINGMIYFNTDDITGDANPDVTVGMQIDDGPAPYQNVTTFPVPSNFGKKGAGTLRLTHAGSTLSGNVDVMAGVLQIYSGGAAENKTYSCLGNPQVSSRTLTVRSGGELYFMVSDVLGQLATSVKMATVISNATLRLANSTCNGFGPLTLHNAQVVYNGGTQSTYGGSTGSRTWGVMGLGGRTVFSGTNAYTFAVTGAYCRFSLGYGLDFWEEDLPGVTNYNGKSEFVVRDVTTNANADVTFEAPLQDIPSWPSATLFKGVTFKCGLLKSGDGTLRLASTDNTYTGPTVVTQGVLRVDGSLIASAVTVKSGGYLAGTGTVANVTMEDGARFEVFSDQTAPLKIGSLTAADGGKIVVHNPADVLYTTLNAPVLQLTSGAFDASKWTVSMDGVADTPNLRARVIGSNVYARWAPLGTMMRIN